MKCKINKLEKLRNFNIIEAKLHYLIQCNKNL